MFRSFLVIATFFLTISVQGQELVFSGKISGMADEDLVVEWPEDWFGTKWKDTLRVENGAFSKTVQIPASGWITLFYKDKERSVYAWKGGRSLSIEFDADYLDDVLDVKGAASIANDLLLDIKEKFGSRLSVEWLNAQALDATNIDAMEMETFALRNDVVSKLNKLETENSEAFKKHYQNHIGYFYYLSLFKFSAVKTNKSSIPKATEIPKVLMEGLSWERMNRPLELEGSFFRELLIEFVNYKALEAYDFMKFSSKDAAVQEAFNIARESLKGESLRYFLAETMLRNAENVRPSLLRQIRSFLKKQEQPALFLSVIDGRISERLNAEDEVVEVVEKGKAKPTDDIQFTDLNGKSFDLSDFRGKVIYLDIWASWCGPCRKQFPFAKELKSKFSKKDNKNIVFLYISIDNTEEAWKKAIDKMGIEGKHGLSPGGWGSEITRKMKVSSIPRYFIIDKKGNVVDENAPRPSTPELYGVLKKLAGK